MNKYTGLSDFEINKKTFILNCKDDCIQYKDIKQRAGSLKQFYDNC